MKYLLWITANLMLGANLHAEQVVHGLEALDQLETVDEAADSDSSTPHSQGCNPILPAGAPDPEQTPITVYVDQKSQKIDIQMDEFADHGDIVMARKLMKDKKVRQVSTGGGLKFPNGEDPVTGEPNQRPPYCAKTPEIRRHLVRAITEDQFDPSQCDARDIRAKTTVFETYHSGTFTDASGNPVPMRNAIRIDDEGDFLHCAPRAYAGKLGKRVSGGCVRLSETMCKFLFDMTKKYGGIRVNVTKAPAPNRCNKKADFCDARMEKMAQAGQITPVDVKNGTEDTGSFKGVESFFQCLFQ
jgi:hypothetical protein